MPAVQKVRQHRSRDNDHMIPETQVRPCRSRTNEHEMPIAQKVRPCISSENDHMVPTAQKVRPCRSRGSNHVMDKWGETEGVPWHGKGQSSTTLKQALAGWARVQALGPCVRQPGKLMVFLQELLAPWAAVSRLFFLLCRIVTIWKLAFGRHLRIMFVRLLALIYKLKIYCFIHFSY